MNSLDNQVLFFDLAGTLVDVDATLPDHHAAVLREVGRRARRIVLITGQSSDDTQLLRIVDVFRDIGGSEFVAYVTRGGCRLVLENGTLVEDTEYLARNSLDIEMQGVVRAIVDETLAACDLEPLIPVQCMDEVAVRINLVPDKRVEFIQRLLQEFSAHGLDSLQAVSEGRTSVFVMRKGVGKRRAVENELELLRANGPISLAYYVGNEFEPGGNDREVLGTPGLEAMALGPIGPIPESAVCRTVGETPVGLYRLLRYGMELGQSSGHNYLPVVCLSLGGTKLQVGALTVPGAFLSSPQVHWREAARYADTARDTKPQKFCDRLAEEVVGFLERRGYGCKDVGVLGIAFPGPCNNGRWYSNNLPTIFRHGVDLQEELRDALTRRLGSPPAFAVRVRFDAQCDAGGELRHPAGAFQKDGATDAVQATVLNLATGIAAGFIKNGRVLVTEEDFRHHVGASYDAGAGQLGRHLWYYPADGEWHYHFAPNGGVPDIANAVRMTDRLSGPALAARLLLQLGQKGLLSGQLRNSHEVALADLKTHYSKLVELDPDGNLGKGAQLVRSASVPIAKTLLSWADLMNFDDESHEWNRCVASFAKNVAVELGAALSCWMTHAEWQPYGRNLVLTGGVGIRFLASSDPLPGRSFLSMLRKELPLVDRVQRSRLEDATERESYMFLS